MLEKLLVFLNLKNPIETSPPEPKYYVFLDIRSENYKVIIVEDVTEPIFYKFGKFVLLLTLEVDDEDTYSDIVATFKEIYE